MTDEQHGHYIRALMMADRLIEDGRRSLEPRHKPPPQAVLAPSVWAYARRCA
jgi:hypothetical protein